MTHMCAMGRIRVKRDFIQEFLKIEKGTRRGKNDGFARSRQRDDRAASKGRTRNVTYILHRQAKTRADELNCNEHS